MKHIDFYVEVIDNFWDTWFAVNIAINYLEKHPDTFINFYSNDKKLFDNLAWNNTKNIKYIDLNEIKNQIPNDIIFNFFDRKIDYDFFYQIDKKFNIINFWYFSTHKNAYSLHKTNFTQKNVEITHFIPSIVKNTWGIIVNKKNNISKKEILPNLKETDYQKTWVSVFVYPETFLDLKNIFQKYPEILFFIFDDRNEINLKNTIQMPFLEMTKYYEFLNVCDKNIVRWENSFIQAILAKKPFLWDIYKEPNNAHTYKLDEFWDFLENDFIKKYLLIFNLHNKEKWFNDFINYENKTYFNDLWEKLKKMDLMKNLEEML